MIAALILRGVVIAEIIHALGHVGHHLGIGFHLLNGGLNDGMEYAIDQTGDKLRKIHSIKQCTGHCGTFAGGLRREDAITIGVIACTA